MQAVMAHAERGNKLAAVQVVVELSKMILDLHMARERNREIFRAVERMSPYWPGLLSADNDVRKATEAFVRDDLQLGKGSLFNFDAKQSSRETPEVAAAWKLFWKVHPMKDKCKLPPFNRKSAAQWWKIARPFLEELYGEHFENHVLFANSYRRTPTTEQQATDKSLSFNTWRRQQIITKTAQAFGKIARKSSF